MNKTHEAFIGALSFSVTPVLNYIHRGIGDFTVHGVDHSREVERQGLNVLKICNQNSRRCNTSSFEEYLVIGSAWLHDLGNIYGRKKHNESVREIIDRLYASNSLWGVLPNAIEPLKWICYAHSTSVSIESVPEYLDIEGRIKLRYLAALLRLLDASDMANRRAPVCVYELLKDHFEDQDSAKFWLSHQAIMDVFFPDNENSIIITVNNAAKAEIAVEDFIRNFDSVKNILKEYEFPWSSYRVKVIEKVPESEEESI